MVLESVDAALQTLRGQLRRASPCRRTSNAHHICCRCAGRPVRQRRQVKVQSVKDALRAVAQKYVLDGYADPRKSSPAQHNLDLPISRLLKKFGDADPPKEPKLAVPTSTILKIKLKYMFSSHHMAVADLCINAFFYLLQVGEYTLSQNQEEKQQ